MLSISMVIMDPGHFYASVLPGLACGFHSQVVIGSEMPVRTLSTFEAQVKEWEKENLPVFCLLEGCSLKFHSISFAFFLLTRMSHNHLAIKGSREIYCFLGSSFK